MTYGANLANVDLEIERLWPERRRHGPRNTDNQTPERSRCSSAIGKSMSLAY